MGDSAVVHGAQDVFVSGRYLDTIDFSLDYPQLAKKFVVLDSEKNRYINIHSNLTPIVP